MSEAGSLAMCWTWSIPVHQAGEVPPHSGLSRTPAGLWLFGCVLKYRASRGAPVSSETAARKKKELLFLFFSFPLSPIDYVMRREWRVCGIIDKSGSLLKSCIMATGACQRACCSLLPCLYHGASTQVSCCKPAVQKACFRTSANVSKQCSKGECKGEQNYEHMHELLYKCFGESIFFWSTSPAPAPPSLKDFQNLPSRWYSIVDDVYEIGKGWIIFKSGLTYT